MAFESKFHCLAEIEAFRAGFKGVKNAYDLPNLIPLNAAPQNEKSSPRSDDDHAVRAEMERRLVARLR